MGYNLPTVTRNNHSFGPAIVYIGPTGATPSTDVGNIKHDDGVTISIESTKEAVLAGNAATEQFRFSTQQGVMAKFTGVEWDLDRMAEALGAGTTSVSGALETLAWGGDPICDQYAMTIQHYMAQPGQTLNWDLWCVTAEGGMEIQMGQGLHAFPNSWVAQHSANNWAAVSLGSTSNLFRLRRQS